MITWDHTCNIRESNAMQPETQQNLNADDQVCFPSTYAVTSRRTKHISSLLYVMEPVAAS